MFGSNGPHQVFMFPLQVRVVVEECVDYVPCQVGGDQDHLPLQDGAEETT